MTHDELLREINRELEITHYETWHEGARALLAVVSLHKPQQRCYDATCYCRDMCSNCKEVYPCETIQAIGKELL